MNLDPTDKKILNLLQTDAKKTNKELSVNLNLSVTAVYERIKKLEREHIIKKYVAIIDEKKVDKGFVVFCQIKLLQQTKEYIQGFEKEVAAIPEILECYNISGDYDYLLKIHVKDISEYREFLVNKLSALHQISSKHSIFMIGEVKNDSQIKL